MTQINIKILKITGKLIKDVWIIVGITLLYFCLIEGILSLFFLIKDRFGAADLAKSDNRYLADTYADPSWVKEYYKEFERSHKVRWESYVYWRKEPYRGSYINIDVEGIRRTTVTNQGRRGARLPLRIFMFGGSTMWGTGARDEFTIPSLLAKELEDKGIACDIKNFGQSGYVSMQEIITLMLQLEKNHIPDLVIFYDGVNDTFSAYQQRKAGLPENEFNRVIEFNLSASDHSGERASMVLQDFTNRLSAVRFVRGFLKGWGRREKVVTIPNATRLSDYKVSDNVNLAREVVATYTSRMMLVKALSEHYRFRYLAYWQPTIFQKTHLTEYENLKRKEMRKLELFYRETYDVMGQMTLAASEKYPVQDISAIFADVKSPIYVDFCHLGESGNELVSKRMAIDVLALFPQSTGADKRVNVPRRQQ